MVDAILWPRRAKSCWKGVATGLVAKQPKGPRSGVGDRGKQAGTARLSGDYWRDVSPQVEPASGMKRMADVVAMRVCYITPCRTATANDDEMREGVGGETNRRGPPAFLLSATYNGVSRLDWGAVVDGER